MLRNVFSLTLLAAITTTGYAAVAPSQHIVVAPTCLVKHVKNFQSLAKKQRITVNCNG